METIDRYRGCMLGLAIGDAYGAMYEFTHPEHIVLDDTYQFCYTHSIEAGCYTDDTSQTMCIALSLLACGEFDETDIANRLVQWYQEGYCSVTDDCFDIGTQTRSALDYYIEHGRYMDTTGERFQGNGSLMRIGALPMVYGGRDLDHYVSRSSIITHANTTVVNTCVQYARLVRMALDGAAREDIVAASGFTVDRLDFDGRGWVVNAFNVAMYSFIHTDSYFDAIRMSIEFGFDTDTNASILGMLAGAYYGMSGIPQHLVDGLYQHDVLIDLAESLYRFQGEIQ